MYGLWLSRPGVLSIDHALSTGHFSVKFGDELPSYLGIFLCETGPGIDEEDMIVDLLVFFPVTVYDDIVVRQDDVITGISLSHSLDLLSNPST